MIQKMNLILYIYTHNIAWFKIRWKLYIYSNGKNFFPLYTPNSLNGPYTSTTICVCTYWYIQTRSV